MVEVKAGMAVRRAADGRPYIRDPLTGRERLYTRASNLGKTLVDGAALEQWKLRQLYLGLSIEPGILGATERGPIDQAIALALEASGSDEGAKWGTALHGLSDMVDGGEGLGGMDIPPDLLEGLDRYVKVTADLVPMESECFVVNDAVEAAGSFDRVYRLPDGRRVVGDLKTGGTLRMLEHAVQLAIYATADRYDPGTGDRMPLDVERGLGLIVWVPRNPEVGEARLVWVDLEEGWRLALLARQVRAERAGLKRLLVASPMVGGAGVEEEK